MQDFQSIPGLAGRLFGGATDIRRAQAHHQLQQGAAASSRCGGGFSQEVVKCPRCESTNTKFCYYNNYNLSQPRHFCKSCRRYWTKGGVLRNVPVGGGCRKSKRSSSSSSSATTASPTATATDANANAKSQRRASSSSRDSNSNSGSTSPTAPPATPSSNTTPITFTNPFTGDVPPPAPIFADQAAALASLFAPPAPPPLPVFNFSPQPAKTEGAASAIGSVAVLLAAAEPEAPNSESTAAAADMAPFMSLDTGIFELGDETSAASYWNAGSCWSTDVQDPSVYLP